MVVTYRIKRTTLLLGLIVASLLCLTTLVGAATNSISKGYKTTDSALVTGMAAALSANSTETERLVEPATATNSERFVGIVTTVSDNLVAFSGNPTDVLVATEGEVSVYVSNLNGDIKKGEFVSISPLRGILMRSDDNRENRVVAVALQDFSEIETEDRQIETTSGNQNYKVGKLTVEVSQSIMATATAETEKSALVLAGESLTGRTVNQIQVIAALIIFAVILIIEGSIIYGAIHSTMMALGRNPLAKKAVFKQLLQVSWIALVVLVIGFGTIYLVLWI